MALKFKHNTRGEIPEAQRALYVEREGSWLLDVEGAADKAKLDEFCGNNIALSNELSELKQRFDGIDPDAVRKLADEKRKLEETAQLKAGAFDTVLDARLKSVRADFDKQFGALSTQCSTSRSWGARFQIAGALVPPVANGDGLS